MTENVYAQALEVLRRDGWCKDHRENGLGEHCLIGALDTVCGHKLNYDDPLLDPLNQLAEDNFAERSKRGIYPPAIMVNDSGDTVFGDIESLLEKAAQL